MKVLILGSTGMAGHLISLYFKSKGHDVTTYSNEHFAYCKNIIGDAFDTIDFIKVIESDIYDVIINCIGLLNQVASSNPAKAVYLNSYLPHLIAETHKHTKTKLIHMSTDCVFAGNTGPYFEKSLKDGNTFYDRTKAMGEIDDNKNLTFRNSIIGPDMNPSGIGLFNWFMKQKNEIRGFKGAIWTGVTTLTLAKAMEQAVNENLCGLYNLVNNESISKFDLTSLFNLHFKNKSLIIKEDNKLQLDKSLRNSRTDFTFKVPSYEQMIIEMKEWVSNNRNLYNHYNL